MFQMFQLSFRNPLLTCRICPFLCDIPAGKPLVHPFSIWSKYSSPLITQSQSSPNGLPFRNCSYTTLRAIRNSKPLRPLKIYHYTLGCSPCQEQWQVKVHTDPLLRMWKKNQSWGWQLPGGEQTPKLHQLILEIQRCSPMDGHGNFIQVAV